jgi:CheY-like chemotaxis protein
MIKETLSNKYDAIFVDITTEILDGINATKIIKRKMKKKAPFIIAMTADILDNVKKKCYTIGINGFIKKPIKFEELKAMLSIIKDKVTKQKLIKTI